MGQNTPFLAQTTLIGYYMVFHCIAWYCIVFECIALHGIALHRIAWHCMVLQRLHGVVQLIWRASELPRSASSHFDKYAFSCWQLNTIIIPYHTHGVLELLNFTTEVNHINHK